MLPPDDLTAALHGKHTRALKLLVLLKQLGRPAPSTEIRALAEEHGFRIPQNWRFQTILERTSGQAVRTPDGWKITNAGIKALNDAGITDADTVTAAPAAGLRAQAAHIQDAQTRDFVLEAIAASEHKLYRSAIVLSWLAAIDVLHATVVDQHLSQFNAEAKRVNGKWKPAKTKDDLGRMNEEAFLDRLAAISAIGKNVKEELKKCLDRRNACGHPNSYRVADHTVAHHLEVLILNVFQAR